MNIPTATYRLQFNSQFSFAHAARIASYLADLGISHIYASPIFKARKGSAHGYDGVDPNHLNPELGTASEFEDLHRRLAQNRIGWLQDIVPNHMAFDSANRMLMDVLQNGSFSKYYDFFDIDWEQPQPAARQKLKAPFLGRRFAQCLEKGEFKLGFDDSGFVVNYHQLKLPLRIESWANLLKPLVAELATRLGEQHRDYVNFVEFIKHLKVLGGLQGGDKRRDGAERITENFKALCAGSAVIRKCVEAMLQRYNQVGKNDGNREDLGRLLSEQVYCLCYWKVAGEEINYRRFFDINELICLRQESRDVFDVTHRLIKRLVDDAVISGVRIDHIDGLANPAQYLRRLRDLLGDCYILVEKILEPQESLPASWQIQGSTGYDFTCQVNGLFCCAGHEQEFNRIYKAFSRQADDFGQIRYQCKRQVLENHFDGDLDNLVARIKRVADRNFRGCDMTRQRLKQGLAEILVRFPVYRTYIDPGGPSATDRAVVKTAVQAAGRRRPQLSPELRFIRQLLLEKRQGQPGSPGFGTAEETEKIIVKFQQLTAPLMAKGFEDTALYAYNRLVSLNEVGADPQQFGCGADDFHRFIIRRTKFWPHSMNSTATHDSKRGEDIRARINVLSELPAEWEYHLKKWQALNRTKKVRLNGEEVPGPNEEYFLYQTLLGVFPFTEAPGSVFIKRIAAYLVKAVREAKIHSSWSEVNREHEAAVVFFAKRILHPVEGEAFLKAFFPFFKKVAFYGLWNTLSQTLLKITAPGVADFYQGTELFDFHLVDPDNRRAVDFKKRNRFLTEILDKASSDLPGLIKELLGEPADGRIKLFLIARALRTRNTHPALFQQGSYVPLAAAGMFKDHVIAFARNAERQSSITVVPRFLTGLVKENQQPLGRRVWKDTEILITGKKNSRWKNIFTEETLGAKPSLNIGNIFKRFPCALLLREDIE